MFIKYLFFCFGCALLQIASLSLPESHSEMLRVPQAFMEKGLWKFVMVIAVMFQALEIGLGIYFISWWVGLFLWLPVAVAVNVLWRTRSPAGPFFLGVPVALLGLILLLI